MNTAHMLRELWNRITGTFSIRFAVIGQRISESQWFLAFVGALLGVSLSYAIASESVKIAHLLPEVAWVVDVSEGRSILLAFVGIEITALSIVMSLTMVAVQNASNQFSPRLLRFYLRDKVQQMVFAVIAGSTAYFVSTAVLIGLAATAAAAPRPSISVAVVLILLSGVALVVQVNHTLQVVRIEVIMFRVMASTIRTAELVESIRVQQHMRVDTRMQLPASAVPILAEYFGYLTRVESAGLPDIAKNHRCIILIDAGVGDPVIKGEPLAWVQPLDPEDQVPELVISSVRAAIGIDKWRDPTYDVSLGMRQLVDTAIKALSPAINDPHTAVQVVDHLAEILVHLTAHDLGYRTFYDDDGKALVQFSSLTFFGYLLLATDEISRYGSQEPSVIMRLLLLASNVGAAARSESDKEQVTQIMKKIAAEAERNIEDPRWLKAIRAKASEAENIISSGPTPDVNVSKPM